MQSVVNKGREDFIRHPMTQGVINGAVFLMTGGIEGIGALAGGIKTFFRGGTTVYRAVSQTEAAAIRSSGRFALQEGGVEVKYFAKSLQDVKWYWNTIYKGEYTIIKGVVDKSVNVNQYWFPNIDIGAYVFPQEILPFITPR